MRRICVTRRPRRCPRCGGEVCDILYGEPTATWEEDYMKETGRRAVLGGCIITSDDPDYECAKCGQKFWKLSFPRNSKQLAKDALLREDDATYCDVRYEGLYKKQKVYRGVVKEGVCCDGFCLVFVGQNGRIKQMQGVEVLGILEGLNRKKYHPI